MFTVTKYKSSRNYAVWDPEGGLIVVTVYKVGASNVARILNKLCGLQSEPEQNEPQRNHAHVQPNQI